MNFNYLINNITGCQANAECGFIKNKYDEADTDERISIIRDILDLYTDKAKFAEPKKYYVHFIKSDRNSYLNISWNGDHRVAEVDGNFAFGGFKTKFTRDEVIAIDPRFLPFMEEIEDDE